MLSFHFIFGNTLLLHSLLFLYTQVLTVTCVTGFVAVLSPPTLYCSPSFVEFRSSSSASFFAFASCAFLVISFSSYFSSPISCHFSAYTSFSLFCFCGSACAEGLSQLHSAIATMAIIIIHSVWCLFIVLLAR